MMAIPKANQQLGQQREQAQAGPTYAPIENQPALFAAQAIYRSQEQLSRTIGQAADTFAKAHQAEERIKVKEAESEMSLGIARARQDIQTEEQEFAKENKR